MEFAPVIAANPSPFTRIYFAASLLVFSLLPLSRHAPQRMSRLVYLFYGRRMVQ